MQSGAFLDTILRNVPVCALTSSRLYNFSNIVTYILTYSVMIPMHLGGGRLLPLKYPRYNPVLSQSLEPLELTGPLL